MDVKEGRRLRVRLELARQPLHNSRRVMSYAERTELADARIAYYAWLDNNAETLLAAAEERDRLRKALDEWYDHANPRFEDAALTLSVRGWWGLASECPALCEYVYGRQAPATEPEGVGKDA